MEYKRIGEINLQENINNRVFVVFMARDVEIRTQKDGVTKYINLSLCDVNFKMEAKRFGATEAEIAIMKNGGVYRAAVDIKEYAKSKSGYSLVIYNFEEEPNMSPSEFIEWADGMDWAQGVIQEQLTETIAPSIYGQLVSTLIVDNWSKFSVWPAASSFHHDVMGGLLVHTAEVIKQCEHTARFYIQRYGYEFLNYPLLISAAMIHDLGKIDELSVDVATGATSYSDESILETHITRCVSMIDIEAYKIRLGEQVYEINEINEMEPKKTDEQLKFEREAISLLKHCVLAHHGKKEYGSPIDMNCPEAFILNSADGMSAELYRYKKSFGELEAGSGQSVWLGGNMVATYKDSTK